MIFYYYAEIYKTFKDYKLALEHYRKSRDALEEYKLKKRKERDAMGSAMLSHFSTMNPATRIFTESKKDNHELMCRVKIIECQAKLKDFSFWIDLEKVIKEL